MITKPFVLSGGGARGFAHLGVVKALEEYGIYPSAISGVSAGAIAGAFLADGFTPDEIITMFAGKIKLSMFTWNSFRMGLVSMKRIREFIRQNLRSSRFEDLRIPLHIAATNFLDGRQKFFSSGDLIQAIEASSSIPVVFPPVFIGDIPYVDGGLSNTLPIEPFTHLKSETVCVNVNPVKDFAPKIGVMETLDRAWHLSFREMVTRSCEGCYLFIEPQPLHQFGMFDVQKITDIFNTGYLYTKEMLQHEGPAIQ